MFCELHCHIPVMLGVGLGLEVIFTISLALTLIYHDLTYLP